MKKTYQLIHSFLFAIGLLILSSSSSFAAETVTGNLQVCDDNVLPVKLEDVVGLGLSAGGGQWNEVNPADDSIIQAGVSNIFVGIDRLPGTYKFIFIPSNNPCLENDDRAVATIEVLETPNAINHFAELCAGETVTLDLSNLVSATLKANHTITYYDGSGSLLASSSVSLTNEGEFSYLYKIDNAGLCTDNAKIVVNVIGSGVPGSITFNDRLAFCASTVPASLNLNQELGLTGKGGDWTAASGAPAVNGGIVNLLGISVGNYEYTYKWNDCSGVEMSKLFTLSITDELSANFVDASRDICKTIYGNGTVDLMQVLGISLPSQAGVWSEVSSVSPVDVADGVFEVADSRAGKYVYKYSVGNAVDLCGIQSQSATVTLNVYDGGQVLDGLITLCKASLTAGDLIDLGEYMVSLPNGGTWYAPDGSTVSGTTIDVGSLALGINSYRYEFDAGPCGNGDARLYVVVTDDLSPSFKDKAISYCLTDDGADHIDLDQVLGIAGLEGSWSNDDSAINFNASTNVFDGRAEGKGTYTFTFTASESACGVNAGDKVTITVKITDDLTQ